MIPSLWSRREFLKAGGAAALAPAVPLAAWSEATSSRVAFAASNWRAGERPGIRVFAATTGDWRESAFHSCERPSALALNAAGDRLYVANCTDTYGHLPCGSVETYRVVGQGKELQLLHRTPLALASVLPNGMALSPDGSLLLVIASGCGLLNAVSVNEQLCATEVTAVHKELVLPSNAVERTLPQLRFVGTTACVVADTDLGEQRLYSCSHAGITLDRRKLDNTELAARHPHQAPQALDGVHPPPLAVVFA